MMRLAGSKMGQVLPRAGRTMAPVPLNCLRSPLPFVGHGFKSSPFPLWGMDFVPPDPQQPQPIQIPGPSFLHNIPAMDQFYNFALRVDHFNDVHVPKVCVADAKLWRKCNGTYRELEEEHNSKPVYRNAAGAVIYFDNGKWKLNMSEAFDSSVYSISSTGDYPPDGTWTDSSGGECHVEADCASHPGWTILADSSLKADNATIVTHATTFVILGNNKRGKTWIMSQLAGCDLPFDSTMHTPGLCMKQIKLGGGAREYRLIDSKGENTPLEEVTEGRLKERTLEESFFREVACEMADAFIYVVGDMGYEEQTTLNELSNILSVGRFAGVGNQIIVIHNLKGVRTKVGLDNKFQELKDIFANQGFIEQDEGDLLFLQRPSCKGTLAAVHLVLGASGTEADANNHLAFDKVRGIMKDLPAQELPLDLSFGEELAQKMSSKVPRYYQGTDAQKYTIAYNKDDFKMELTHGGSWKDVQLRDVGLGNFIKIEIGADLAYTISDEVDNNVRIVRLSVPGCSSDILKAHTSAVQFSQAADGSRNIDVNLQHLRPTFESETTQKQSAPVQNACRINIGKQTIFVRPDAGMSLKDGVLTLKWNCQPTGRVDLDFDEV